MIYSERGFTLAEAVIVIVITGIVAGAVAMFMRLPVQSYLDGAARAELTDTADSALRRMTRDLRLALPNSVRVTTAGSTRYIEVLLTKTGGRYLSEEDGANTGTPLSFTNSARTSFDALGSLPAGAQAIRANDFIVVYNLGPGMRPADAYDCTSACNRAQVAAPAIDNGNNTYRISLVANPFAGQSQPMPSPGRHFQVVETSVTYACDLATGKLNRYSGYGIQVNQPNSVTAGPLATVAPALLASGVTGCAFSYDEAGGLAAQRSGLVGLSLTLQVPGTNSGAVTLFHQVHIDNTP